MLRLFAHVPQTHQSDPRDFMLLFSGTIALILPRLPISLCLSCLRRRLIGVDLLPVLVIPDSRWWSTVSSSLSRSHAHDLAVDGARDAVLQFQVHFWDSIVGKDGGVGDITCSDILLAAISSDLPVCDGPSLGGTVNLRIAALSTMLRMVNLLMALSFGVHREQLEQRMGLTWPRPFLFRPLMKLSVLYRWRLRCHKNLTWTLAS